MEKESIGNLAFVCFLRSYENTPFLIHADPHTIKVTELPIFIKSLDRMVQQSLDSGQYRTRMSGFARRCFQIGERLKFVALSKF